VELISSIKHPAVIAARESLGQLSRKVATAFLAEGSKMITEALTAKAPIHSVFFLPPVDNAEDAALLQQLQDARIDCHVVSRGVFSRILGLGYETATRVLALVNINPLTASEVLILIDNNSCILIGEKIQDPRNVGVILRTADACGVKLCVFSADSADPYSRASVRSTTSSIFRMPLHITSEPVKFIELLKKKSVRIIGTSANAQTPCWQADLSHPCALVLGNESIGLSEAAKQLCDMLVTIPMHGGAHSFNVTVAAGILLYESMRQDERRRGEK
jgi:RNA methyltransferase, TrmH family